MIQIIFRNLEKSELARNVTLERLESLLERFPDLRDARISVTLSMENSRLQAGPDLFRVKVFCHTGRYRGVTLQKAAPNLYIALADVVDHMLERLNRFGDRSRVRQRAKLRKERKKKLKEPVPDYLPA